MTAQIKAGIGLLTSMFALLLSLQLSAGRSTFDTQEREMTVMASRTVLLDRILAHYGPETREARESLRENMVAFFDIWTGQRPKDFTWQPLSTGRKGASSRDRRPHRTNAYADCRGETTAVPLMLVEIA